VVADGGHVERCQDCGGALRVRAGDKDDPVTTQMAQQNSVVLAEFVSHVNQVVQIGHRADCPRKGRAANS
jgi:hypothetical protein